MTDFINIRSADGRASSIEASSLDSLEIIGVLPHCTLIHPDTVNDAIKLRNWLNDYISLRENDE